MRDQRFIEQKNFMNSYVTGQRQRRAIKTGGVHGQRQFICGQRRFGQPGYFINDPQAYQAFNVAEGFFNLMPVGFIPNRNEYSFYLSLF